MQHKVGDLVEVSFGGTSPPVPGVFVSYDERCCFFDGEERHSSRAMVFWDGEIISTPIEQIEVINESR